MYREREYIYIYIYRERERGRERLFLCICRGGPAFAAASRRSAALGPALATNNKQTAITNKYATHKFKSKHTKQTRIPEDSAFPGPALAGLGAAPAVAGEGEGEAAPGTLRLRQVNK